jgi:hypothetical protein
MTTENATLSSFLEHLTQFQEPLILRKNGRPPVWTDEELHRSIFERDPALYALLAAVVRVTSWQRARILFQILSRSRHALSAAERNILDRITTFLLAILHPDQVLTVFLSLRRVRANHKRTSRAMLTYLLNHPCLEDMLAHRRPALADCLEHALGKNVARAGLKRLAAAGADEPNVQRHLLRLADDPNWTGAILSTLYRPVADATPLFLPGASDSPGDRASHPAPSPDRVETERSPRRDYTRVHVEYMERLEEEWQSPATVTATNRGDIAATLVHLYRGGTSPELSRALDRYVEAAAAGLPRFEGRLALVLDASASTRSYGDREFCCLAQSVALWRVLERCCAHLQVYTVGGSGHLPVPQGSTDLAGALLDALSDSPDLVAIVSDGYENTYAGDLARVLATLPQVGIRTPVVFCHSKFTRQDDLSERRPARSLPELEFWHQNEFAKLILSFGAMARGDQWKADLREYLHRRLEQIERELDLWTGIR